MDADKQANGSLEHEVAGSRGARRFLGPRTVSCEVHQAWSVFVSRDID